MGTKGFSWTLFGSLQSSSQTPSERGHKGKQRMSREPSPRSDTAVQVVRRRERDLEEDRRRQREAERMNERKRERERETGAGHKEREWAQEREGRCIKSEKEVGRQYERTGMERLREVGTYTRRTEPRWEREERLIKNMSREGDRRVKHPERQRGRMREDSEKAEERERKAPSQREQRDIQGYREMERWSDYKREKEYWRNGGAVKDKEIQLDPRIERWEDSSPRYRKRDMWEENELRRERERGKDREGAKHIQYERGRGFNTYERPRISENGRGNFSDREIWERERQRQRVTKSDGDGEGDIQKERERDSQGRFRQKHSRSEGDGEEERARERYKDGGRHKERDQKRVKDVDKAKARYRERERRENHGYSDRYMERDLERYEDRQRYRKLWKEPETGREEAQSQIVGNGLKYTEKGSARDQIKYYREEGEKHYYLSRERHVKKHGDIERENMDEGRTYSRLLVSDSEMETAQSRRLRQIRTCVEPQRMKNKNVSEFREGKRIQDKDVEENIQACVNDAKSDRVDEDRNDKLLGTEIYCDGDLESDAQSKKNWQGDGNMEAEDVSSSTDESSGELDKVSEQCSPSEDGESEKLDIQVERMLFTEDDFVTVSSGGEENHKKSEDCKEFLDRVAASEEDMRSAELKPAKQMEIGREQQERGEGDGTCEGEDGSKKELRDLGVEVEMKTNKTCEEKDGETMLGGQRNHDDDNDDDDNDDDDDGDNNDDDDDDENHGNDDNNDDDDDDEDNDIDDDDDGNGDDDRKDPKVTVFCVIGQTLPRTSKKKKLLDQTVTEDLERIPVPDIGGCSPLVNQEKVTDRESEAERDVEESDEKGNLDILFISEKGNGIENSEILLESNDLKDSLQHLDENGGHKYSENVRNVLSAENESGTESTFESLNVAQRHTGPCSELKTESGLEGGKDNMCTADRMLDKESCTEHEAGDQRQTEPIFQTTDESSRGEEQYEEETTPYLKRSVDVETETPDASEKNPSEKQELQRGGQSHPPACREMDTPYTLDPFTNCDKGLHSLQRTEEMPAFQTPREMLTDDDKDTQVCEWIATQRHSDRVTNSETEEKTSSGGDTDPDVESDPNPVVSLEQETTQIGADGGIEMKTENESYTDTQMVQNPKLSFIKRTLSKSNSCPSPVNSPDKDHFTSTVAEEDEKRKEKEKAEMEDTNSIQGQGNMARSRRMMWKVANRWKEQEPGLGRDRRTRVFDIPGGDDELTFSYSEAELRMMSDSMAQPKNSRFFNSQLYQEYSEVAQNQEILRQSHSDTISTTSPAPSPQLTHRPLPPLPAVLHPHSISQSSSFSNTSTRSLQLPPASRSTSPRLSNSLSQSPSLWQDLPGVRNSMELSELNEDERRLQEVRFEVVTSEASYCRSLDIVVDHFVKSKTLGALLTAQDKNWLFSRLGDVRALSHSFLSRLEEQVEKDLLHFTVCDIIVRYCPRFRLFYVPYLTNQSYQDKTYQRLMGECPGFRRVVESLERSPVCQRLPLRSFLVLPFQRITRLKLLVQNIVKRTASNTKQEAQAIKALKMLEKLIQESNDSITQMKNIESLVSLSSKVDFECRTLPLVSQSRQLIREGTVAEMRDFALKETERTVYLHLFNDYLLLSLQKEGGRFTVIEYAPTAEIRVENCRVKLHSLQKSLFRLHLSSQRALLLRTDTQSDKLRWISALSRPHPDIDFTVVQDLTQVQCIKAFVAQQPDEISLEKADVLLVHQQSSDGWVEGTRLSDRQRGWVPESHLEVIVNERARQCNLLDTQKIKTATATY